LIVVGIGVLIASIWIERRTGSRCRRQPANLASGA
jgi:hypothetical protein